MAPRCRAQSCQASSCLRGWLAPPGITTAPTYGAWGENAEGGVGEELRALGQLETDPQVGLVTAVAGHRLGVGHPREGCRDLVADEPPQRREDLLGERDDVVLLDEAHLDVQLGELRLSVGAEVLVAVAPGDLVVALHPGDHQQLLEQLGALRQCVPAARLQARGDQEVAGALRGGPGQRRGLDLDEVVGGQHVAGDPVDLAAQPQCRGRTGPAQVEVAVGQPDLLADLAGAVAGVVDGEGQGGGRTEHLDAVRGGDHLDVTGRQARVLVALRTRGHLTGDLQAVLRAQLVRDRLVADHDLDHAGGLPEVDEGDAAVVAPPGDPAGEGDGLADVLDAETACVVGADHWGGSSVGRCWPGWDWSACDEMTCGRRSCGGGFQRSASASTWFPLRMSFT